MFNLEITNAVMDFTRVLANLPDNELDHPWQWKGHDEGIRFAFFVLSRELRELAVRLESALPKAAPSRRILAQYHAAFMDLQAVLHGISNEDAHLSPSEKDWPVRRVLAHILGGEINFSAVVRYALEGHRSGNWNPAPMSDADEARLVGISEAEYGLLMSGSFEKIQKYHQKLHLQIISDFSAISADELELPATFWEPQAFPIRYRLHRFEAHMRQHTIQIEKTLSAIDLAPAETKRLICMLFAALAEVEGHLIGVEPAFYELCKQTVSVIDETTYEITQTLTKK